MTALPHYGVDPSMRGAENDEQELAIHLAKNAPLGMDGKEAFRMAEAQFPQHKAATLQIAAEIAMRELLATKAA